VCVCACVELVSELSDLPPRRAAAATLRLLPGTRTSPYRHSLCPSGCAALSAWPDTTSQPFAVFLPTSPPLPPPSPGADRANRCAPSLKGLAPPPPPMSSPVRRARSFELGMLFGGDNQPKQKHPNRSCPPLPRPPGSSDSSSDSSSDRLAQTPGKLTFIKVDVDEGEDITEKVGISSMPTFKVFQNGKEVDGFTGADKGNLQVRVSHLARTFAAVIVVCRRASGGASVNSVLNGTFPGRDRPARGSSRGQPAPSARRHGGWWRSHS